MGNKLYNQSYFNSITEGWNKISFKEIHDNLLNDHRLDLARLVLDLGCGTGLYNSVLKRNNNSYIGIDISISALITTKPKGLDVIAGAAEAIPVTTETVDYVFSTEVIEHVNSPAKMMEEIHRILKPGGCGFITTTTYQFVIFHYIWVLSQIGFRVRDIIKYPIGFFLKQQRNEFVRLLYDFTGGHLWGFMKKDLIQLIQNSSLNIEDVYYLNVQPVIPLKLKGGGLRKIIRRIVVGINSVFLNRKRAIYGPNIIIKFSKVNCTQRLSR